MKMLRCLSLNKKVKTNQAHLKTEHNCKDKRQARTNYSNPENFHIFR